MYIFSMHTKIISESGNRKKCAKRQKNTTESWINIWRNRVQFYLHLLIWWIKLLAIMIYTYGTPTHIEKNNRDSWTNKNACESMCVSVYRMYCVFSVCVPSSEIGLNCCRKDCTSLMCYVHWALCEFKQTQWL